MVGGGLNRSGHPAALVPAAVGALSVPALWAPWFRSGASARNSFDLFRSLQLLGLDALTPIRVVWFLLPMAFAAAVVLLAAGRVVAGRVMLAGCWLVVGVVAALVGLSGSAAWGTWLALVLAAIGMAGLVVAGVVGSGPVATRPVDGDQSP